MIKPTGLRYRDRIQSVLEHYHGAVAERLFVDDYRQMHLRLFTMVAAWQHDIWFQLLDRFCPDTHRNRAEIWYVTNLSRPADLVKRHIRHVIGIQLFLVEYQGVIRETTLTPVHSPDPDKVGLEDRIYRHCGRHQRRALQDV